MVNGNGNCQPTFAPSEAYLLMTFVICFKLFYINVQFLPREFVFKHELCCLQPQLCYGSTTTDHWSTVHARNQLLGERAVGQSLGLYIFLFYKSKS